MHIFCVTHDIDGGGAGKSLFLYCREWRKLGCAVTVLSTESLNPNKKRASEYQELGIPVHCLRLPLLPVSYINAPLNPLKQIVKAVLCVRNFFLARRLLLATKPDVILYNSYAAMSVGLFFKGPAAVHIRDVLDATSFFMEPVTRYIRSRVRRAIAIGSREAAQAEEMGIPVTTVFNFPATAPAKEEMPETPPYHVAVVGQIHEGKGQADFVRACMAAKERLRNKAVHVTVYGGEQQGATAGPAASLREFVAQAGCEDIVTIHGWTDDVEGALAGSNLLVRPDKSGSPWGRDIIEAMSMGRPVLSAGDNDIFIKPENGLLVPLSPVETLAPRLVEAMLNLAESNRLTQLGDKAFTFAQEYFDPARNARAALNVLLETTR